MKRFIHPESRGQATLFPERIEDYIDEDNPVSLESMKHEYESNPTQV